MSDIETAHARINLEQVMSKLGIPMQPGTSRLCPFCSNKNAELKDFRGIQRFKCWHSSCPTTGVSMDSIDMLRHRGNLTRKEAIHAFLEMAGVQIRGGSVNRPVSFQSVSSAQPTRPTPPSLHGDYNTRSPSPRATERGVFLAPDGPGVGRLQSPTGAQEVVRGGGGTSAPAAAQV